MTAPREKVAVDQRILAERERILRIFDQMVRSVGWENQVSKLFAAAFRREVRRG